MNDIARVTVHSQRPLFVDAYTKNRVTGAFILVDALTNDTVAAGMIVDGSGRAEDAARDEQVSSSVMQSERRERVGHGGAAVVLEASGAGGAERATAHAIERRLFDRGYLAVVVSGEGAEAAAAACVEAGVIAVCVASRVVGSGIRERLGSDRVVFVGGGSADEMTAEAVKRLSERGVV
jgi:bifunctional enzyme CysN/CysC/sulfate adenylyltransferase subunit 1